ncbi:hypothetical protein APUTEX25_001408 [Auxenochlorella protothecoides]|uniref:CBF1-interacting co-repressor CIR N-terminal domain-containing protein n=1 Tax=Auxenochlorella protothecoides TaxID=3075 RepID=A0A3M7L1D6_AUXPR|nr:hypothetical protein APUTEX25_001408 [Auxenochlorella protothecoides]|eukprot:RMZ56561.1 hypothetical protein APUTEX25_001408 [Auxenochlorella protothecoides]
MHFVVNNLTVGAFNLLNTEDKKSPLKSFLNQKPWHPMNFRNQARVWEAEQAKYEEEKKKAEAKAEFEAEQEYLQTLSMLSAEEQEKYRQRQTFLPSRSLFIMYMQSVSFLYMKPPGYDASLERLEQANRDGTAKPSTLPASGGASSSQAGFTPPPGPLGKGATAGTTSQAGPGPSGQTPGQGPGGGGLGANYLAKMLEGYRAAKGDKFELKGGGAEMGRSPPRGGVDAGAANQQFVIAEVDSEEEERALREAGMTDAERRAAAKQVAREARAAQKAADRSSGSGVRPRAPTPARPLDLQRLGSLVQDPRPIDQKQAEVLEVVETRVADYVEKGTALEAGLKAGVASVLPQGIKDAIPATLRESLLGRDTGRGSGDAPASRAEPAAAEKPQSFANNLLQRQQPAPATAPSSNGASAPGLATWTITTDEEDGVARPLSPGADVSGAGDAPPAILAELAEVLQGVGALKSTLLALRTNGDPALGTMSRLNVREAEETLRRRLQQLSAVHAVSAVPDPEVAAAIQEGEALLAESAALTD